MGREGEREGVNIDVQEIHWPVASHIPPTRDLASNPDICPDWEVSGDPLVCRLAPNPLSHIARARAYNFYVWEP